VKGVGILGYPERIRKGSLKFVLTASRLTGTCRERRKVENMESDINYAIVAKTHPPMYSMHRWWARKPHNVVSEYIKFYSKEGDIVLDPFAGSGVTALEAVRNGRKAVAIDLDPVASFITRCTFLPIDLELFDATYHKIASSLEDKINALYETICNKCGTTVPLSGLAWKNGKPFEKVYHCPNCKNMRVPITDADLKKVAEVERMKIPYWCPSDVKLSYGTTPFMKAEGKVELSELFTKRNLIASSIIYNFIDELPETNDAERNVKDIFKFTFTSFIANATKMMPYVHESIGKINKGWVVQSFWLPPKSWELNAWEYFKLRYKEIYRGKKESNQVVGKHYKPAKKFEDLNDDCTVFIKTQSATELIDSAQPKKNVVPPNSVDYIFTDPPYGGAVQYFELSTLWAGWLKFKLDFDDEITINKNQNKDFTTYDKMLRDAFKQMYLVLKPDKYLTVTFHNTDIRIRNSLIRAVVFSGFDLEKIVYQPPAVRSVKSGRQPYGSAIGDYYIRFKKSKALVNKTENQIDEERYERVVIDTVKGVLAGRGEPTPYSFILNSVDVELQKNGLLLGATTDIKEILDRHIGKEFVLVTVGSGSIKGKAWWFKNPSEIAFLDKLPLNERVEKAVLDVLKSKDRVSLDDVLQYVFIKFPNSHTPETTTVVTFLKEYAIQVKGKWRLKPEVKETEGMHSQMELKLCMLGRKLGFKVYCADRTPEIDKVAIKDLELPLPQLRRIKEIDVLWLSGKTIKYVFEVENSTQITDAIIRASNIPYKTKKFIIIPKQRLSFLKKKFTEPMIQQRISWDKWDVITYDAIDKLSDKKSFVIEDLSKNTEDLKKQLKVLPLEQKKLR